MKLNVWREKSKEVVFLNGKFLPLKEARLPVVNAGFLYGWGLFETMRSYKGNIVYFKEHLERIKNSCKALNLYFPYSLARLKKYIEETVKINDLEDAYVRLTLWKNHNKATDVLILARKYNPISVKKYRRGFYCLLSETRINENYFFSRFKTTNYLLYRLSYLEAKEKNFDEAIFLNYGGYLAEGSRSSIFFVRGIRLFTPSLDCGCLNGITRNAVFELARKIGIKIYEGKFTLSNLLSADEAFLTNSLMGIMPLAKIGKFKIGRKPPKITPLLMKNYNSLLTLLHPKPDLLYNLF